MAVRSSDFPALILVLMAASLRYMPQADGRPARVPKHLLDWGGDPPTSDKPQSKLWFNAGSWWADMWVSGSGGTSSA